MRKVLYILGQLSDDDVEWLIDAGQRKRVPGGTTLIREGEPTDAMYVVLDGLLAVSIRAAASRSLPAGIPEREIAQLGAGEIVGEMSFVDARPPSASVRALRDSLVLSIPRAQLALKLDQDLGFAARFNRALATFLSDRLRSTMGLLGYGANQALDDDVEYEGELDPNVLDNVHLAGARFQRILQRLAGHSPA